MCNFLIDVVKILNGCKNCEKKNNCENCNIHIFSQKIALVNLDACSSSDINLVKKEVNYIIALIDDFHDKERIAKLYKKGFADVRPKRHKESLVISIKAILRRKELIK